MNCSRTNEEKKKKEKRQIIGPKKKKYACFCLIAQMRYSFPMMWPEKFFQNKWIKKIIKQKENWKKEIKMRSVEMLGHSSSLTLFIYVSTDVIIYVFLYIIYIMLT